MLGKSESRTGNVPVQPVSVPHRLRKPLLAWDPHAGTQLPFCLPPALAGLVGPAHLPMTGREDAGAAWRFCPVHEARQESGRRSRADGSGSPVHTPHLHGDLGGLESVPQRALPL